jgi:P-loop Domain of unknown function (DUF2791)
VVDQWLFTLEQDALATGIDTRDEPRLAEAVRELMDRRLATVAREAPMLPAALRAYHDAIGRGDTALAQGLLAWIGGQPHVAAATKRAAGVRGDIDHYGAMGFLRGLLTVLRDSGHAGLVLVLDEVETLQRVRSDVRERGLNALRQLLDEVGEGSYAGLYLVITGTPAFFDGPQGVRRLPPLAQRLHVDFSGDARFDNPRDVQIRLPGFGLDSLVEVGRRVRDLYADGIATSDRIQARIDDTYLRDLAVAIAGELGGKVGIAPRVFLRKLVAEVLDRVDLFEDFDPRRDYSLTVADAELTDVERAARSPDDVALDV